jgi:hypothetical protein
MKHMVHRLTRGPGLVALRTLLATSLVLLTGACGSPRPAHSTHPGTRPPPGTSTSAAPVADLAGQDGRLRCTASGAASPSWPPPDRQPVGVPAIVSASTSGDTLTLRFAHGTPAFRTQAQSSAQFTRDPSGARVALAGTAGVAIRLTGFRGDTLNSPGAQRLAANGRLLREVREVGDFEGTVSWGAGLAAPGCANVERAGSTLRFRFIPLPSSRPLVAVVEGGTRAFGGSAAELVTLDGRTVARAAYLPRRGPYLGNVAAMLQPDAQVGRAGVYVMDGTGVVHLLRPSGRWDVVATFEMTPEQHEAWFAVAPDGGRLVAGVLSVPAKGPANGTPWPPLVGTWRYDLESATAGGPTRVLAHSESATWPNQPGSGIQTVSPVGWPEAGPVAMVGAPLATQNVWLGGPLFTIDDGRVGRRLAGDCTAAWVLPSGLAPCASQRLEVTVRDAAGGVRWRPGLDGSSALSLRLAPSGDAITDGRSVSVRGGGTTDLPAGFVGEAWLDATTLAGRAANGDAAYVRLGSLDAVHDLGVWGDAIGPVPAA